MHKYISIFLPLLLLCLAAPAQNQRVQGHVATRDSADLTILSVAPDSFPTISLVFKAESKAGEPVWNLTKEKMIVQEDGAPCEVVALAPISERTAVHLCIVVDHSGSMAYDQDAWWGPVPGKMPIDDAKRAVKEFVSDIDFQKDDVSVIGFASTVDQVLKPTRNRKKIERFVDAMEPTDGTAFYDALDRAVQQLRPEKGVKVVIALTDGGDNSSWVRWETVVDRANEADIPIYTIGLGAVIKDTLQAIADGTHGRFFHTKSSSSLAKIYAEISRQVNAFYQLSYRSPNMEATDTLRTIDVHFEVDSLYLQSHAAQTHIPEAVIAAAAPPRSPWVYAGAGAGVIALVAAVGVVRLSRRGRKPAEQQPQAPQILALYPNPTSGTFAVDYTDTAVSLKVIGATGALLLNLPLQPSGGSYDIGSLPSGVYIVLLQGVAARSNPVRVVLRH